jgi:hypothetical protein
MFCPKCSYEYREGFYVCPDCNIELVDKLPEKQLKIIEEVLFTNKPIPKRFWVALISGVGLIGIWYLHLDVSAEFYYDLGLVPLVDIIFLACISSLLLYPAYWGLRNIKPLGRISVYFGLTIITIVAAKATAYFFIYTYYWWPSAFLYILGEY